MHPTAPIASFPHRLRRSLLPPAALAAALALLSGCATTPAPAPDAAARPAGEQAPGEPKVTEPRAPVVEVLHGVPVSDPFRWLENGHAPEVRAWMDEYDARARGALAAFPGRDALAERFRRLFYVDSVSPPLQRGGRYFFTRTHADREKAILYWREGNGPEKVLLDPNGWSEDGTVSLGRWEPSWDGRHVVFARKENAADEATLYVIRVDDGVVSSTDVIPGGKYASPSWTPDSQSFYYEYLPTDPSIPVAERPGHTQLRAHRLGADPSTDPIIHPATKDPRTFLSGEVSRDGRYVIVYIHHGWTETDVWIKDLERDAAFRLVVLGQGSTYWAQAWEGHLYILTDEGAPRLRVFKTSVDTPEREHWKPLIAERPDATLQAAGVIGGHLALVYLKNAASELAVATLDGRPVRTIPLPTIGSVGGFVGDPRLDDAYFSFSSYTVPQQVYRTSMKTGAVDLWAKVALPLDTAAYEVQQVFYPSRDGTRVSMFLVHRKGLKKTGDAPVLLYGYGGFNVSMQPGFRASIYPWLDAGGVYAVPHLRGGGEYGRAWHDAGRGANKQNVFDDFEAAARWLVKEGYTRPGRLAIAGGSNGGLLVGAAMTQHPDLFGAVVCAVPLLDMVRYHLFGSGQTWIHEYGSADNPGDFQVLHAYSPYHRVRDGVRYPPLLMLSADSDDRVDPMHARKFVARLEAATGGESRVLLRIEKNAGHGGADQVRKAIESAADQYAFLFATLGVTPP